MTWKRPDPRAAACLDMRRLHASAHSEHVRCARRSRGFTLIELVVVTLLLAIMAAMVVINLNPDDTADVQQEARRLALLLQTVQQEAILQGQVFAVSFERRGYRFLRLDQEGSLAPVEDDALLRARELPGQIRIDAVEVDGNVQEKNAGIVLPPSGQLPAFTITLRKGQARWLVIGSMAEGIKPSQSREARATS